MDSKENELCSEPMTIVKHILKSSRLCKVCGNKGARMFFGAECCAPCKVFFRRNSKFDLNTHQCVFNGQCDITVNSRNACRYCRIKKCLYVGLQREMIRSSRSYRNRSQKRDQQKNSTNISHRDTHFLPTFIPTINLLRHDQSLLTFQQWSLLLNVLNTFDETSSISTIRNAMARQSTYPSKMRLKMAKDDFEYISSLVYVNVGPFMGKISEFKSLPTNDQVTLVKRNFQLVGDISGTLILREVDLYNNPYYYSGSITAYGPRIIKQAIKIIGQADPNGLLLKLCLPLLVFSTCSNILNPNLTNNNTNIIAPEENLLSNSIELFHIQNIYVEVIFKYMLYQFGYKETILRFFGLVKTSLDLISLVVSCDELQKYEVMVETITKETQEVLILNSENNV